MKILLPHDTKNEWDIAACILMTGDDYSPKNKVYEWKEKGNPFVEVKSYVDYYDAFVLRKKIADIEMSPLGTTAMTFTYTTYSNPVTAKVVGRCINIERTYFEIRGKPQLTINLKWDSEAEVCRWKASVTLTHTFKDYGIFPSKFIATYSKELKHEYYVPPEMNVSVNFFDADSFFLGNKKLEISPNYSDSDGWFNDPESIHICKQARKIEAYDRTGKDDPE